MLRQCIRTQLLWNFKIMRATTQNFNQFTRIVSRLHILNKEKITCTTPVIRQYSGKDNTENMIVDYNKVKNSVLNKDTYIIDVREPEEIKEHGKIPNSINIPLGNVSSTLGTMNEKEFEKVFKRPKPSENSEIIFYCMIGKRSGMAQQNAINLGFKNVKNYLGSWTEWANKSH